MKRLHVVTEGHGDVEAMPCLIVRVLVHLERHHDWIVAKISSRMPRSQIVDEKIPSPLRGPRPEGIERAVALALAAQANALLVVVDADDDCPAAFGPAATALLAKRLPGAAVMAVREFETWLLLSHGKSGRAVESKRDAKGQLRRLVPGYKPTVHQAQLARTVDAGALQKKSASFSKFVRDIARLTD